MYDLIYLFSPLPRFTKVLASLLSVVVIGINLWFVVTFLSTVLDTQWWPYLLVCIFGVIYFCLIIYLSLYLVPAFGFSFCCNIPVRTGLENSGEVFLINELEVPE